MKQTGRGGTVSINGSVVTGVQSFSWEESQGKIKGETESRVSIDYFVTGKQDIIRPNDKVDLNLGAGNKNQIKIRLSGCLVNSTSMSVERDGALIQSMQATCYTKATIA